MGGFRPSPSAVAGPSSAGTVTSDLHQITGSVEITGSLEVNGVSITGGGGGGGGDVAGSNTQVQFNDGGDFGASSNLTFTGGNTLNAANLTASAHLRSPKIGVGANATTQSLYVSGETRLEGTTWASHFPLAGGAENVFIRPGTNTGNVIIAAANQDMMVGIGTGSPTAKLHVSSSHPTEPLFRIDHSTQVGTPPKPILYVTGSGLVAIGTDSPRTDSGDTNRLHIMGESGADQGINPAVNSVLVLENNDHVGMNFISPSNRSNMIIFGDADVANKAYFRYIHGSAVTNPIDRFSFDGTFGEEVMTIARAGDSVNIGQYNANHYLTNKASLHISSSTSGNDIGGPVLLKIDHGEDIDKTNILYVTGSGRVGINTGSPAEALDVADDTDASARIGRAHVGYDGTNANMAIFAHRDNATPTNYSLRQRENGSTEINAASGETVTFRIASSVRAQMASDGKFGFGGNFTPAALLHVSSTADGDTLFRVDAVDQAAQGFNLVDSGGAVYATVNKAAQATYALDVGGNVRANQYLSTVNGTSYGAKYGTLGHHIYSEGATTDLVIHAKSDKNIILSGSDATKLIFSSSLNPGVPVLYATGSGFVGIGTATPSAVLDVNGRANATTLSIGGTPIEATADELNLLDASNGAPSAGTWAAVKRMGVYNIIGEFTGAATPQLHDIGELPAGALITNAYLDVTGAFTASGGAYATTFFGIGTTTTYDPLGGNPIISAQRMDQLATNGTGTVNLSQIGGSTSAVIDIVGMGSGLSQQYPPRKLPSVEAVRVLVFDQGGGTNGITNVGAKLYLEYTVL